MRLGGATGCAGAALTPGLRTAGAAVGHGRCWHLLRFSRSGPDTPETGGQPAPRGPRSPRAGVCHLCLVWDSFPQGLLAEGVRTPPPTHTGLQAAHRGPARTCLSPELQLDPLRSAGGAQAPAMCLRGGSTCLSPPRHPDGDTEPLRGRPEAQHPTAALQEALAQGSSAQAMSQHTEVTCRATWHRLPPSYPLPRAQG